jgi:hypothetical protein
MNDIKNIADRIREKQKAQRESSTQNKNAPRVLEPGEKPDAKVKRKKDSLLDEIRSSKQVDKNEPMVHIRLPRRTHLKLSTLNISIQKFALYAIEDLLEQNEIKEELKRILNELD